VVVTLVNDKGFLMKFPKHNNSLHHTRTFQPICSLVMVKSCLQKATNTDENVTLMCSFVRMASGLYRCQELASM